MSTPSASMICGHRAAGGHADPAPGRPVDRDAARARPRPDQARRQLAEQVIRRRVVALAVVPEPARHRAEGHGRADGQVARPRAIRLNQPSAFTSKTRSNWAGSLFGQRPVDEQAARVDEHVEPAVAAAHVGDHRRARLRIAQIERCSNARSRPLPRPLPPHAALLPTARHWRSACRSRPASASRPGPAPLRSARPSARPGPAGRATRGDHPAAAGSPDPADRTRPGSRRQVGHDLARDAAGSAGHQEHRCRVRAAGPGRRAGPRAPSVSRCSAARRGSPPRSRPDRARSRPAGPPPTSGLPRSPRSRPP